MTPLVEHLEPLPGFRNVLVHEYVTLNYDQVLEAVDDLGPVEEFVTIAAGLETEPGSEGDDGTGGHHAPDQPID